MQLGFQHDKSKLMDQIAEGVHVFLKLQINFVYSPTTWQPLPPPPPPVAACSDNAAHALRYWLTHVSNKHLPYTVIQKIFKISPLVYTLQEVWNVNQDEMTATKSAVVDICKKALISSTKSANAMMKRHAGKCVASRYNVL